MVLGQSLAIGIDVGGTKIAAGIVAPDGSVLARAQRDTPERSTAPDVVEDQIVDAVESLIAQHRVESIGIGAAGFVDADRRRVMFAPHLSWRNEPLALRLTRRLRRDVVIDNDANTALWAEMAYGAAREADNAVLITLGTGIGSAVLISGDVYRGFNGMAGEFGHVQVVPSGRPCECGRMGCWEQYCSGKALRRFVTEAGKSWEGPEITEAALGGDPVALGAYDEVGRWLGIGVANVVAGLDPEMVIIGGGVSAGGELLLDPAKAAMSAALVGKGYRIPPELLIAHLGGEAGMIGAAEMARSAVRNHALRIRPRRRHPTRPGWYAASWRRDSKSRR